MKRSHRNLLKKVQDAPGGLKLSSMTWSERTVLGYLKKGGLVTVTGEGQNQIAVAVERVTL